MKGKVYSEGVITRLSQYLRFLLQLRESGKRTVTSQEISGNTNINSAEVRRDIIYFGLKGKRGVGFNIEDLITSFNKILGYSEKVNIVLVGAGNLGRAILNYKMLDRFGFKIENVFDNNPEVINKVISGRKVMDINRIQSVVGERGINIAILAVPEQSAQSVTDILVASGIKVIINYTAVPIRVPKNINVQTNDPIEKLFHTLYYLSNTVYKSYN
ncbi:MAG: redox-sensing transcriptional repressor Rex [Actinobacteria bacterium]|nr:redox-sensing transcriptional repressor Rex [Actinomycetota bacterium]